MLAVIYRVNRWSLKQFVITVYDTWIHVRILHHINKMVYITNIHKRYMRMCVHVPRVWKCSQKTQYMFCWVSQKTFLTCSIVSASDHRVLINFCAYTLLARSHARTGGRQIRLYAQVHHAHPSPTIPAPFSSSFSQDPAPPIFIAWKNGAGTIV